MAVVTDSGTPAGSCSGGHGADANLSWMLHRAAQIFRQAFDDMAQRRGLEGMRAFIVLDTLRDAQPWTQAALGQQVGVDKTTLTALLDRLERDGLLLRRVDPKNRRARFPELTEAGRALLLAFEADRRRIEAELLASLPAADQQALRTLLQSFLAAATAAGPRPSGSCM